MTVQACCGFGVTLSPPGPISSCDPVELSAVVSGGTGPYQYTWMVVSLLGSFAQLLPEDSDTLLITGPESGADYVVCVTDAYGCQACSDRVWVTIETGVASYELAQTVCEGLRLIEYLSQVSPCRNDPLVNNSHPLVGILACQFGVMFLGPFDIIPVFLWRGLRKCVITHFLTSVSGHSDSV